MINWTEYPITGIILTNAVRDSMGELINPGKYYWVGKVLEQGKDEPFIIIIEREEDKNKFDATTLNQKQ